MFTYTCAIRFTAKKCPHPKCPSAGQQINYGIFIQQNITQKSQATTRMELKAHVEQKKAATGKHTASIPFIFKQPENGKLIYVDRSLGEAWKWTAEEQERLSKVMEMLYVMFCVVVTGKETIIKTYPTKKMFIFLYINQTSIKKIDRLKK